MSKDAAHLVQQQAAFKEEVRWLCLRRDISGVELGEACGERAACDQVLLKSVISGDSKLRSLNSNVDCDSTTCKQCNHGDDEDEDVVGVVVDVDVPEFNALASQYDPPIILPLHM